MLDVARSERAPVRFAPSGIGGCEPSLRSLLRELAGHLAEDRLQLVRDAAGTLAGLDILPALRYRAALSILEDLLAQGWGVDWFGGLGYVRPPSPWHDGATPATVKSRLRLGLQIAVREQLAEPSVDQFLRDMERNPRMA